MAFMLFSQFRHWWCQQCAEFLIVGFLPVCHHHQCSPLASSRRCCPEHPRRHTGAVHGWLGMFLWVLKTNQQIPSGELIDTDRVSAVWGLQLPPTQLPTKLCTPPFPWSAGRTFVWFCGQFCGCVIDCSFSYLAAVLFFFSTAHQQLHWVLHGRSMVVSSNHYG